MGHGQSQSPPPTTTPAPRHPLYPEATPSSISQVSRPPVPAPRLIRPSSPPLHLALILASSLVLEGAKGLPMPGPWHRLCALCPDTARIPLGKAAADLPTPVHSLPFQIFFLCERGLSSNTLYIYSVFPYVPPSPTPLECQLHEGRDFAYLGHC